MTKFITTTGYYGTGSSAITDVLSDYSNVLTLTDYEFRFIQDPNGIMDLEYHLVQNNHRHNSGYALKKFKKKVDFLNGTFYDKKYRKFLGNTWKIESYKYINSLIDFSYKGYWHQDLIDKGRIQHFIKRTFNKILKKTIWKRYPERSLNELPNEITYYSYPTRDYFIMRTKEYIENIFLPLNDEKKDYIMIDQIVASSNISEYTKYFNNIKVFLVDRDPRDVYLLEKYVYKGCVIPVHNINDFCKWYRLSRSHRKTEILEENVMFLYFEDLIFKYDQTLKRIEEWLNLSSIDKSIEEKTFNPNKSIKNTMLWKLYPNEKENIERIEIELKEYLYEHEK